MPCTGVGVYAVGRAFASAPTLETVGSLFAAFLGAELFAAGFFLGAAFLAAPVFFFIFMGRTLQQRTGSGQVRGGESPFAASSRKSRSGVIGSSVISSPS